ncbi:MAG: hypothetical protein QOK30_3330 [Nocardioidaceae bacterium]|nr:hypothetical protein [Nocardioidaceae bacterium]
MADVSWGVVVWLTDLDLGISEVARAVEDSGMESLFLTEHTHIPVSRRDVLDDFHHALDPRILDQFTVLGAAAAVTSRVKLGTGACIVTQRDPIILAKQVATLDHLSQGRFLFGVGAGWLVEEMRNHGVSPERRWDLMREHVLAMKEIWCHDEAEFHGRFVDFDPILSWPKPVTVPHPPILVGAAGPRGLRGAAEFGDGWMPIVDDLSTFEAQRGELHRLCAMRGRADLEVTAFLYEADEQLLEGCARLGVSRCAVLAPTNGRGSLESFLERYSALSRSIA